MKLITDPNTPQYNRAHCSGFTLIEVMVVVLIIGILASIVALNVSPNIDKGFEAKIKNDLLALESALDLYKMDHFSYPTTDQGLEALVVAPSDLANSSKWKKYIKRLPKDPWEKPYVYRSPGQHGEYDISSYGADGQPGGENSNKDFGNWNL